MFSQSQAKKQSVSKEEDKKAAFKNWLVKKENMRASQRHEIKAREAEQRERLEKAEAPIRLDEWEDTLSSWQALLDLLPKMKSERGVAILEAIFADRAVVRLAEVEPKTLRYQPPQGLGPTSQYGSYGPCRLRSSSQTSSAARRKP